MIAVLAGNREQFERWLKYGDRGNIEQYHLVLEPKDFRGMFFEEIKYVGHWEENKVVLHHFEELKRNVRRK